MAKTGVCTSIEKKATEERGEMLYSELDEWLASTQIKQEQHFIEASTLQNYTYIIKLIKKWMMNTPLWQLTDSELQIYLNLLADIGYSKSAIRKVQIVLNQAYEFKIRQGVALINPTRYTSVPIQAGEKDVLPLTIEQQERLERACRDDLHGDLFLFLLYTGLRRAELCALKWADFDLKRNCIFIRKSKTKAGIRAIPLLPVCAGIIALQPRINEYIFNSLRTKQPVTAAVLRRTYQRLRKKTGIMELTSHVCRHTFATRMLEKGADPKAISTLLGHTSVAFTLDRYVRAQPEYLQQQIFLLGIHELRQ